MNISVFWLHTWKRRLRPILNPFIEVGDAEQMELLVEDHTDRF